MFTLHKPNNAMEHDLTPEQIAQSITEFGQGEFQVHPNSDECVYRLNNDADKVWITKAQYGNVNGIAVAPIEKLSDVLNRVL